MTRQTPAADQNAIQDNLNELERISQRINQVGFGYSGALALIGVVWLIAVTDWALFAEAGPIFLLFFVLGLLLKRFRFFFLVEVRAGVYSDVSGTLESIVSWSAALLFGPSALWIAVVWQVIDFVDDWRQINQTAMRWSRLRNLTFGLLGDTLVSLIALLLYQRWGGVFPLPGLAPQEILLGLLATVVRCTLYDLIYLPHLLAYSYRWRLSKSAFPLLRVVWFNAIFLLLPYLTDPFAILGAGLFAQNGVFAYLFFSCALLLTSVLARQFSSALERGHQRSRELEKAEQLARAILAAPPDGSLLPALLREHTPGMFPRMQIEIQLFPAAVIVHHPEDSPPVTEPAWEWLAKNPDLSTFLPGARLPWNNAICDEALIIAPILSMESDDPLGGIYVLQRRDIISIVQLQGAGEIERLIPAVQSLAAQIASSLHSADTYAQTLINQRTAQELSLAGKIQSSFLPRAVPEIAGWQLTAALEPARQTSGDFYDFIPLPDDRLGLVIADVADKGMGAALYMALSRTLIRIYAHECCDEPSQALEAANRRILRDTHNDLFVTVFYAVLDPRTGQFTYTNAGHNPPYLLRAQDGALPQPLARTGIPLGLFEDRVWEQRTIQLAPGDVVVMYTDGLTDALNSHDDMFGDEQLREILRACQGHSARAIQKALLSSVHRFMGNTHQFDDITLLVLARV